jgi:hypothetical protein
VVQHVADQLGTARAAQLLLDVSPVGFHRAHGEVQLRADLDIGVAQGDQAQDLDLALGQAG